MSKTRSPQVNIVFYVVRIQKRLSVKVPTVHQRADKSALRVTWA